MGKNDWLHRLDLYQEWHDLLNKNSRLEDGLFKGGIHYQRVAPSLDMEK